MHNNVFLSNRSCSVVFLVITTACAGLSCTRANDDPSKNTEHALGSESMASSIHKQPSDKDGISGSIKVTNGKVPDKISISIIDDTNKIIDNAVIERITSSEAEFRFSHLTPGRHTLRLFCLSGIQWIESSKVVNSPDSGVLFSGSWPNRLRTGIGFHVLDRLSGDELRLFNHRVYEDYISDRTQLDWDWATKEYRGVNRTAHLEWIVQADNYQAAWGNETAFAGKEGIRYATIFLDRGWGRQFRFVSTVGNSINGVVLNLDGEIAGVSDDFGVIRVNRFRAPNSIKLVKDGWTVDNASCIIMEDKYRNSGGPEHLIVLKDKK